MEEMDVEDEEYEPYKKLFSEFKTKNIYNPLTL